MPILKKRLSPSQNLAVAPFPINLNNYIFLIIFLSFSSFFFKKAGDFIGSHSTCLFLLVRFNKGNSFSTLLKATASQINACHQQSKDRCLWLIRITFYQWRKELKSKQTFLPSLLCLFLQLNSNAEHSEATMSSLAETGIVKMWKLLSFLFFHSPPTLYNFLSHLYSAMWISVRKGKRQPH